MGSTCCKKYESPYIDCPQISDVAKLFSTCSEQFQLCTKYKPKEDDAPPRARKFSRSDISLPMPIGCTLEAPKRPPRKRKCRLSRSQSMIIEPVSPSAGKLARSKSIHEIVFDGDHRIYDEPEYVEDADFTPEVTYLCLPLNSIADSSLTFARLEPILESDSEDSADPPVVESPSSSNSLDVVADNKRHFLATLLADDGSAQLNSLPSRKSSITESLREFESSLYDMLEQQPESIKDEIEDIKWKPQIPIY